MGSVDEDAELECETEPERPTFDFGRPYRLDERVVFRPKPFGMLLYHRGNGQLAFVKSRPFVAFLRRSPEAPSAGAALDDFGLGPTRRDLYERTLRRLHGSEMIRER